MWNIFFIDLFLFACSSSYVILQYCENRLISFIVSILDSIRPWDNFGQFAYNTRYFGEHRNQKIMDIVRPSTNHQQIPPFLSEHGSPSSLRRQCTVHTSIPARTQGFNLWRNSRHSPVFKTSKPWISKTQNSQIGSFDGTKTAWVTANILSSLVDDA